MSTAIAIPQAQLDSIAENCVKSNLFGIKTREQALTLMALCQAEGLHPATAMRDYHLIQNRPAMKADAMLARFQKAGGVVEWQDYTDAKVSAHFSHPQSSPKPVLVEWTFEQAKRIGLTGKDNWRNYPRAMLRARVISEGVRTVYPGIAPGIYSVEEVQDMPPPQRPGVRDMGEAEVVPEVNAGALEVEINATESRADLEAVWKRAAAACQAAGDREAYARLKAAVSERLKVLPEAA